MTDNPDRGNELLEQAEDALHSLAIELLAVQPQLDKPYTDRPGLSPWKRSVGAQGSRAYKLSAEIREHLGVPYRACRSHALGTPPLQLDDVIARAVAAERERIRQLALAEAAQRIAVHPRSVGAVALRKFADLIGDDDDLES